MIRIAATVVLEETIQGAREGWHGFRGDLCALIQAVENALRFWARVEHNLTEKAAHGSLNLWRKGLWLEGYECLAKRASLVWNGILCRSSVAEERAQTTRALSLRGLWLAAGLTRLCDCKSGAFGSIDCLLLCAAFVNNDACGRRCGCNGLGLNERCLSCFGDLGRCGRRRLSHNKIAVALCITRRPTPLYRFSGLRCATAAENGLDRCNTSLEKARFRIEGGRRVTAPDASTSHHWLYWSISAL